MSDIPVSVSHLCYSVVWQWFHQCLHLSALTHALSASLCNSLNTKISLKQEHYKVVANTLLSEMSRPIAIVCMNKIYSQIQELWSILKFCVTTTAMHTTLKQLWQVKILFWNSQCTNNDSCTGILKLKFSFSLKNNLSTGASSWAKLGDIKDFYRGMLCLTS